MLTIEALRGYGANVKEGLARCFGDETFYLRLVRLILKDAKFEALAREVAQEDYDAARQTAGTLQETAGNLSLTPLVRALVSLTEALDTGNLVEAERMMRDVTARLEALRRLEEA